MSATSSIEWTDATWNPVRGCTRVSSGCGGAKREGGCYAEDMAARFSLSAAEVAARWHADPKNTGKTPPVFKDQWGHGFAEMRGGDARWTGKIALIEDQLTLPLHWRKPRKIFVNSTSDLFHEALPDEAIDRIFAVMALSPQHTFQVLTKRPERMRAWFDAVAPADGHAFSDWPLPNVWLGTSVEDQATADERIPHLLQTPAAIHFLSCEPLLGPLNLWEVLTPAKLLLGRDALKPQGIDWVIVGGESGTNARPMHPDWPRHLRGQCAAGGVPFFFKQWGEWMPAVIYDQGSAAAEVDRTAEDPKRFKAIDGFTMYRAGKRAAGRLLDGAEHNGFPEPQLTRAAA